MHKRLGSLIICIILMVAATGCSEEKNEYIFTYDLSAKATILDPQYASSQTDSILVGNLFEGLLVERTGGVIENGVAESYTVSENGLIYTFNLRSDAVWSNGSAVTADDFVFMFERLLEAGSISQHSQKFMNIKNAAQVYGGQLSTNELGVKALGNNKLQITLEQRQENFLNLLCETYAAPCNREFFEEQRGKYGTGIKATIFNGPFVVKSWDNTSSILLLQNESYTSEKPAMASGVRFYFGRENAAEIFINGKTDSCYIPSTADFGGQFAANEVVTFNNTSWVLVFNADISPQMRHALASSLNMQRLNELAVEPARQAQGVLSDEMQVYNKNYRTSAGSVLYTQLSAEAAAEAYSAASSSADDETAPYAITQILVSEGALERSVAGVVQNSWANSLNLYTNVQPLEQAELLAKVKSGEFDVALLPLTASGTSPLGVLGELADMYTAGTPNEQISTLQEVLAAAGASTNAQAATTHYNQAEKLLVENAYAIPLYTTSCHYVMATGVSGVEFSPALNKVYFKYAALQ